MKQYFSAYFTVLCVMAVTNSVKGSCPNGHYCPSPGDERPCPKGFFNPNTDSTSHEACGPCTPGSYCATEGLSAPTGPCSPGWYCLGADISSTPLGKECWPGHYCPGGTAEPLPCPQGTYQENSERNTCTECPVGHFCIAQGLTQTSGVCDDGWVCEKNSSSPRPTQCPKGHACVNGVKTQCPVGMFQDLVRYSECQPCKNGSYCATAGLEEPTSTCSSGWYCYQGETVEQPPGQICPQGHMCQKGIKYVCRSGTYQNLVGQQFCTQCNKTTYCNGSGLSTPTAECELGQCCQNSLILPSTCIQGEFLHLTFSAETRPNHLNAHGQCYTQGSHYKLAEIDTNEEYNRLMTWFLATSPYVVDGELNLPASIWLGATWSSNGYLWDSCDGQLTRNLLWGQWAPGEDPEPSTRKCLIMDTSLQYRNVDCNETYDVLCEMCSSCPEGFYHNPGTGGCQVCPKGYYCDGKGLFAPTGKCLSGFYCTEGSKAPDRNPCIPGMFCANGIKKKCKSGTYQPDYGAIDCLPCPAGRLCDITKLSFPSGLCSAGSYCLEGTDSHGIACPKGHRCPTGSIVPIACESGTYQSGSHGQHCRPCPEGKYCDKTEAEAEQQSGTNSLTHGVVTPKPCPELTYCRIGSTNAVCDDDPYEPGSVSVSIQCNPTCNQTLNRFEDMQFTASCLDCPVAISSYVWSFRECVGQNLADCHYCKRWIHYFHDNDSPNFIYRRMWSNVDVTGWVHYLVVVKVILENGDEGQGFKMIEYVIPWTDPVPCTVSPIAALVGTLFDISCDQVPREDKYLMWYWLYSSDVVLGDGDQRNFQNIALPGGDQADDFYIPLRMVATVTNDTFYSQDIVVQVFSPVDGGFGEWTAWSSCPVTCGTGSQSRSRDCTNPVPIYGGSDCVGDSTETQDCSHNTPCTLDGGFTEWTAWGSCSVTCATGSQSRSRDCTNPAPQYGGSDCIGDSTETQDCNTQPCPIDGGFTEWAAWGPCSDTCGTGSQSRSRDCTNPAPQYGGDCVGDSTETQDCNTNSCPIDGGFTEWTSWTSCTVSCETGSQTRSRDCTNPTPQYGGSDCIGDSTETQDCNTNPCPIDGGFTEWTTWDSCTLTCGTGSQSRSRDCTNPAPQYGGSDCVGDSTETQDCNTNQCPIDGGFSEWTTWGSCTLTCGIGSQSRSRDCTNPAPQYGGSDCDGDSTETQDCNTNPCPVDGGFSEWTAWGSCSETCGTGSQSRSRDCTNPAPQYGGSNCVGDSTETQDCNIDPCPIDGGFTEWTTWDSCTLTCGTGSQSRSRDCTNPAPQYGGSDCVGDSIETQDCNTNPCPINGGFTEWTAWGSCSDTCGTGSQSRSRDCTNPTPQYGGSDCAGDSTEIQDCNINPCPIDGGFSEWTSWDSCTLTCGTGSQSRSRDCTNPASQYGGSDCIGDSIETQDCNTNPCPIDGGFSEWTTWDSCTLTCGTGSQSRSRDCTNPAPQYGGNDCVGDSSGTQACNTNPCPIDGGFSEWTTWDSCTLTCETGSQSRSRDCTNPAPQYGGSDCVGDSMETQNCNTNPCPIDGGFSEWTTWVTCTVTCGTGSQSRSRDCTNPAPQHGGSDCVGDSTETQDCNTNPCPIDGSFNEWTTWDSCTLTCGTGSQFRSRDCTNPVPQYGGSDCVGDSTETQDCNTNPCPINGGFSEWTSWDYCTLTCGTGSQSRSRECTNPAPQYGGSDCVGDATETQDCNTNPCPIDGGFSEWTTWDSCTLTCGTGSQSRSRDCTNPAPQYGGSDCVGYSTETQDCNTNPCPIDGGFSEWTLWDSCTLTCGTGSQSRSRDCTDPAPQYGGSDCVGDSTETQDCNTDPCPVDGGFTEWTAWGPCSDTCGTGSQSRSRDCTNPVPLYGGSECVGDSTETQDCNTNPCPIDGGFTEWTSWGSCSETCQSQKKRRTLTKRGEKKPEKKGSQSRSRDCTNPAPQYGGSDCIGDSTETQDCNINPCPIDGDFTKWTAWESCPVSCGTGSQSRSRDCTNPVPQYGGSDCVGDSTESQDCNTNPCPIDGGFTEWTTWGSCSETCQSQNIRRGTRWGKKPGKKGSQSRSRDCTNPAPQYGGSDCIGDSTETQNCNINPCPIDGDFTKWTAWESCPVSCGTGSQSRSRDCTNPVPQYGGSDCVGDSTESQDCNTNPCPIDGGFTEWTTWGSCSETCQSQNIRRGTRWGKKPGKKGSQSRSRDCTNPAPQYGGSDCIGDSTETQNCNINPCPIDGDFTKWTAWESCPVSCGTGSQSRSRDCTNPVPQYGGSDCVGDSTESQDCNTNPCPIDGGFTEWTTWGSCSETCQSQNIRRGTRWGKKPGKKGSQSRSRDCTNPAPQYGGSDCIGDSTETQNCNINPCPIDGDFTKWTAWESCPVSCGTGSQSRSRDCTNPVPQYGGSDCVGDSTESQDCNTNPCPIDGGFTEWTTWGSCSETCQSQNIRRGTRWGKKPGKKGSQSRSRDCTNPAPQYGGSDCIGDSTETQNCNINPCPIDGDFTKWTAWESCPVSCGTGSQSRSRDCTNPVPQYGGSDCVGDSTESQDCNTNPCPIDGDFTEWTTWGSCSETCQSKNIRRGTRWGKKPGKKGSQSRSRDCTNPAPQYGGSDCIGDSTETQNCNINPCPIDGDFTEWTAWESCPVSCGTGSQSRSRDCTNPVPQYGGSDCVGDSTESQDCNTNPCPIDGGFTEWTTWGSCTETCQSQKQRRGEKKPGKKGSQSRSRDCTNPAPQYGGSDCIGDSTETQNCNINPCPIDGDFTKWTSWESCPVSCGTGSQSRSRDCTNPVPQYGGSDCVGDSTESQDCNTNPCPIDGGFTEWTAWGTCSQTCGTGSQSRSRDCTNPAPQYGGSDCEGDSTEIQDCNTNPCPIDGGFTEWTAWGSCTVTCGTGSQSRSRDCTNPVPQYGGSDCVGDSTESQDCNTNPCPIDGDFTEWTAWASCTVTCGTGSQLRSRDCTNPAPQYGGSACDGDSTETQDCNTNPCPIDGDFTEWTAWESCPVSCGTGSQSRSRDCTNPAPQYGGSDCVGDSTETQDCDINPCPIDGGFTEWTTWGSCSDTCGTGSQSRSRDCTNPTPQYGGSNCDGEATETQDCNTNTCPIDGGFNEWTSWTSCPVSCGTGHHSRSRDCTNPAPQYGGSDCVGDSTETQDCNTNLCPIDGGFTEWTAWGICSMTCETGSQSRSRDCTNPIPQYGGSDCVGDSTETQECNKHPCLVDGGFNEWTSWTSCPVSCGTGHHSRSRDCTNPAPQYGGSDCVGDSTETQDCNTNLCPIDGGFTEWTAWGICSMTCETGSQSRSRDCTNPIPQYGGSDCVGDSTETQECNKHPCLDPYEPGALNIYFSCIPRCTSLISSFVAINFGVICTDCESPVSRYEWSMRPCDGYQVETCTSLMSEIYYLNHTNKVYTYQMSMVKRSFVGWTYFGMFIKVQLTDGKQGMAYHIWKFFEPAPPPVSCSIAPPTGFTMETHYNISCQEVFNPEHYDIIYSLYTDETLLVMLYRGQTPNVTKLLLPVGYLDDQNNLHLQMVARIQGHRFYKSWITVQVKPVSLEAVIGSGENSVDQLIKEGDNFGALKRLDSAVEMLNHVGEGNDSNTDSSSEEQAKWRTHVIQNIASVNSNRPHLVSTASTVLKKVTENQLDLSEEAKDSAVEAYSKLAQDLDNLAHAGEEEQEKILFEELVGSARSILEGSTSMIELLTETMPGDEALRAPIVANANISSSGKPASEPQPVNMIDSFEKTGKLLETVDKVCDALLYRQIGDADPTVIVTDTVKVAVQKLSPTKLAGAKIQIDSPEEESTTSVTIPQDFVPPDIVNDYNLQTMLIKNPYIPSSASGQVEPSVLSVSLKDSFNNVVDMKNLSQPLKLSFPAKQSTSAPQHLRLKVVLDKSGGDVSLKSIRTHKSLATFNFPVSSDKISGLKFTIPTNLTSFKLYINQTKKPNLNSILQEGHLYPEEAAYFTERFSDFITSARSSSIVYFATPSSNQTEDHSQQDIYVGMSLDMTNNQTLDTLAHLDPVCAGNTEVESCRGFAELSVTFHTFTLECLYWNVTRQAWSSEGCEVSRETFEGQMSCECNHMTLFGGGVLALPAFIDPVYDFLLEMFDNPVIVTTVLFIWTLYFLLISWARKEDRKDKRKVGVIRCTDNSEAYMYQYLVCVITGWWSQAGTTANVFMKLRGNLGDSSTVYLASTSRKCFQRGYEDWFLVTTDSCLGNLQSVTLWHDNSGTSPHWYLEQVYIKEITSGDSWMFFYYDWLALDRGHIQKPSATVYVSSKRDLLVKQKFHFFLMTKKSLLEDHVCVSIFTKPARSTFSRVQRLTCFLSLLLTTMLTDILFYGVPTNDPEKQLDDQDFSLSLSQIVIGVQSSLLVFPVNFLITQLFIRANPIQYELQNEPVHNKDIQATYNGLYNNTKDLADQSDLLDRGVCKSVSGTDWCVTRFMSLYAYVDSDSWSECGSIFSEDSWELNKHFVDTEQSSDGGTNIDGSCCKVQRKAKGLPWWCIYIVWCLVTLICLISSFFVTWYGIQYDTERNMEWLVSFFTACFSCTLLLEPTRIVGVSFFLAIVFKRTFSLDGLEPNIEKDSDEVYHTAVTQQTQSRKPFMELLSSQLLKKIRNTFRTGWLADMAIRDLLTQTIYLIVLLVMIHSHWQVSMTYRCSVTIEKLFVYNKDRFPLQKVSRLTDLFTYFHTTLVPVMEEVSGESVNSLNLGSNYQLIGLYRIRQHRVKQGSCSHGLQDVVTGECAPLSYGTVKDTTDYDTGWASQSTSDEWQNSSPWHYKTSEEIESAAFTGQHSTYPGGGYSIYLSSQRQQQTDTLVYLETNRWLDERTRAVFIEFNLYNPSVDLLSAVTVVFEMTDIGDVFPAHYIYTTSLHYHHDKTTYILICELLFVMLNCVFIYHQCVKYLRLGWKQYLSYSWTYIEILQVMLSLVTVCLFVRRLVIVDILLSDIRNALLSHKRGIVILDWKEDNFENFVNVYPSVLCDLTLQYVTVSHLTLMILKILKLLQCQWRLRLVSELLSHVGLTLLHFLVIFCIVMIAYSHSAYCMFHALLPEFQCFGDALVTNMGIILREVDFTSIQTSSPVLGSVFVVLFTVTVTYCLMSMSAAILNVGRLELKDKHRKQVVK